jgi:glucose/arabinose dehydrogenase
LVLAVLVLVATACSGDGKGSQKATEAPSPHTASTTSTVPPSSTTSTTTPSTTTQRAVTASTVPTPAPTTAGPTSLSEIRVRLTQVVNLGSGFGPLALAQRAGDDTLYVAGQRGRVAAIRGGTADPNPVVDLSGEVKAGGEQGLLGIAFSPDGNLLYASFTDRNGDSRLWELPFRDGRADAGAHRELLSQDQPFANHNGGQITFGPDGLLYVFFGDGGSANDPFGNAQNLDTWLGKILRIDPRPSGGSPYTVPADNPFVGRAGAKPEIWAYGVRNPWRNSFDKATGDLWIGDVGQNMLEEVDYCPRGAAAGANFGWAAYEGTRTGPRPVPPAAGHVPPVYEYPTSDGCAVTGGYVYRGAAVPGLTGAYLFGDFCNGQVRALRLAGGKVAEQRALGLEVPNLSSFGEDHQREVYALSLSGGVFRIDPA